MILGYDNDSCSQKPAYSISAQVCGVSDAPFVLLSLPMCCAATAHPPSYAMLIKYEDTDRYDGLLILKLSIAIKCGLVWITETV